MPSPSRNEARTCSSPTASPRPSLLDRVAVVCLLGSANNIAPEALPHFAGKRIRIFADNDEPREKTLASGPVIIRPGGDAAARWQTQLESAGASTVDFVDFSSLDLPDLKDLNDLARADASDFDLEALFYI